MNKSFHLTWLVEIFTILFLAFASGQYVSAEEHGLGDIPLDPKIYQQYMKTWPEKQLKHSIL